MTGFRAGVGRTRPGVAIALALFAAGCVAEPIPPSERPTVAAPTIAAASTIPVASPARPSASASPVAAVATPEPTLPAALPRAVTIERDGLRVTLELERNPMPAGQPTAVTKTIENVGDEPIAYFPCGEAMSVSGEVRDQPWRAGGANPADAAWKRYLLYHLGEPAKDRQLIFLPGDLTGSSSGCGDVLFIKSLAAGETLRERATWDGLVFRRLAPPPTARVHLTGTFTYDHATIEAADPGRGLSIDVQLDAWTTGESDAFLDPGEVADIALRDPRLRVVLASRELYNGNESVLRFDPRTNTYQVGMLESGSFAIAQAHLLTIDAVTGEIEGWVERDWDYAVDDYP